MTDHNDLTPAEIASDKPTTISAGQLAKNFPKNCDVLTSIGTKVIKAQYRRDKILVKYERHPEDFSDAEYMYEIGPDVEFTLRYHNPTPASITPPAETQGVDGVTSFSDKATVERLAHLMVRIGDIAGLSFHRDDNAIVLGVEKLKAREGDLEAQNATLTRELAAARKALLNVAGWLLSYTEQTFIAKERPLLYELMMKYGKLAATTAGIREGSQQEMFDQIHPKRKAAGEVGDGV